MAGQIIKRGDNTWLVRIFTGRDAKGKRHYFNKAIHGTKKDAQKYLTAKQREKDLGVFVEPAALSVEAYLEKWLSNGARSRLRENTYQQYKGLIESLYHPGAWQSSALRCAAFGCSGVLFKFV